MTLYDILSILPILVLAGWACALLLLDVFFFGQHKGVTALLAALGLVVTLAITIFNPAQAMVGANGQPAQSFGGMVTLDGFATFMIVLILFSGLLGIFIAYDYLKRMGLERGEYYTLLLFSISGMMLMAQASDLIVVFLALELLSIPLYVLAGFARPRAESEEASLKYFLLGAFSTGFVVYGIALVFGATGQTSLASIVQALKGSPALNTAEMGLLLMGAALILIGLGFKVAAVPFHMWTPDVYQGSPSAITAFMAVGAKAGGFAALLRVFMLAFPVISPDIAPVFAWLSGLTMLLGNLLAIAQTNIKRLLAYSSISHAGYILLALVPYGNQQVARDAAASALFYLLAYAFTNFAAWAVVIAMEKAEGQGLNLNDYAGLGRKYPGLAAVMAIAMFSFTGVPPTLGFVAKFYIFRTALQGNEIALALIGVLTSVISAYYYLRVVVIMFMREGEPVARSETWLNIAAAVTGIGTAALIILADPLFAWVSSAVLK